MTYCDAHEAVHDGERCPDCARCEWESQRPGVVHLVLDRDPR